MASVLEQALKTATGIIPLHNGSHVFPGLWLNVQALLERDGAALLKTLNDGLASDAHATFVKQLQSAAQHRQA